MPSASPPRGDFDAEVGIVGYGPSGVSAANFLGALGVSVIAFERDRDIYPRARAVTVNDWTLRCFQSVGLDQALLRDMDVTAALRWVTYAGKELMRTAFEPSTLGHPISCAIYQPAMEQTLRQGAERYAPQVSVRYGAQVQTVEQDAEGVTVTALDTASGETSRTRVRYLLACDGGTSTVRAQLGVKLVGSTLDTRWVVIDARVKRWWPDRHILTFWSDRRRPVVDIALSLGNHRWEFPLEADESESDFATHEQLWKLLQSLGVARDDVEIHQHAFYRHHVRHAERWRVGRVFLLGDAAHLMPPWAGQGMQSGIRDAHNLAWKLHRVLRGQLPDTLLDSYEPERAPNVALMTAFAERLGRIIKMQMTPGEKLMAGVGGLLGKLGLKPPPSPLARPPVLQTGWLRGPPTPGSAVGHMPPQPQVASPQGHIVPLDTLLGTGFVLLGDGIDPGTLLTTAERTEWEALGARRIAVRSPRQGSQADSDVIDLHGTLQAWMRRFRTRVIVLRPDRFVAAAEGSGLGVPAP